MKFPIFLAPRRPHHPDPLSITGSRDEIRETIHLPKRSDLIDVAIDRAGTELTRNNSELTKLRRQHGLLDGHPGHEPGAEIESRGNRALSWTLGSGGLVLQYVVNHGAFGEYGEAVVGAASIGMDAVLCTFGFAALKSINNSARPEQTLRTGKRISLAATGVVFVAGAVAAYTRFATATTSDAFFQASAVSMWALAELTPFVAGLWAAVADLRGYPHRVSAEILDLEERNRDLAKFIAWLEDERAKLPSKDPNPGSADGGGHVDPDSDDDGETGPAGAIGVKIAGLLLAAALASTSASAQICGIASERGSNGVVASRQQALNNTMSNLDEYTLRRDCRVVVVSSYTDAGMFTPRTSIQVPRRPHRLDCTTDQQIQINRGYGGIAWSPGYRDKLQAAAKMNCTEEQSRLDSTFKADWTKFIHDVKIVIGQEQVSVPSRVDIAGVIKSYADAGIRELLLIGTGIDGITGIPDRIPAGMRVAFVVYEVKEAFLGRAATDAASERWRKAGATVLPYTLLTSGIWTRVQLASSGQ